VLDIMKAVEHKQIHGSQQLCSTQSPVTLDTYQQRMNAPKQQLIFEHFKVKPANPHFNMWK